MVDVHVLARGNEKGSRRVAGRLCLAAMLAKRIFDFCGQGHCNYGLNTERFVVFGTVLPWCWPGSPGVERTNSLRCLMATPIIEYMPLRCRATMRILSVFTGCIFIVPSYH